MKKAKKKSRTKPARKRKPASKRSAKKHTARKRSLKRNIGARRRNVSTTLRAASLRGDADSQGLSTVEGPDSESVSELVDEGNTFEAGVVSGVEQADNSEGREVRTREVPEDDVPEEYLDNE